MRRAFIVALFVAASMIGPVVRVQDAPVAPFEPEASPTVTIAR